MTPPPYDDDPELIGLLSQIRPGMLERECTRCARRVWIVPQLAHATDILCEVCEYRTLLDRAGREALGEHARNAAARLEDIADTLLTYMAASRWESYGRERQHRIKPTAFDGAEPIFGDLHAMRQHGIVYPAYIRPEMLGAPLNLRMVGQFNDSDRDDYHDGFALQRFRDARPEEYRGRVSRICRRTVEFLLGKVIPESARVETARYWLGELSDGSVANISADTWRITARGAGGGAYALGRVELPTGDGDTPKDWARTLAIMVGIQYVRRFQWRVYLAYAGLPGIEVPTDPVGAMSVFRLRDLPEGKTRRAALRTWIMEHWRANPFTGDADVHVRQHLRGATEFVWNGLRCRITPSVVDLTLNDRIKEERQRERELR